MTPVERAREFFKVCPPPDAPWYVEEALVPILAEHFRVAEAEEREACAKVVEGSDRDAKRFEIAAAIRARS